jgi:hypothetical protein
MDTSSADAARLLQALAVRALTLALLVGITGDTVLPLLFGLIGLGLLLVPVDSTADADRAGTRRP